MEKLVTFSRGTGLGGANNPISIKPSLVAEVYKHPRSPEWTMIVMKSKSEHCVCEEFDAVITKLNADG